MESQKKIIFCSYQIGCANNLLPIARKFQENGHSVMVFAAGKSFLKWREDKNLELLLLEDSIPPSELKGLIEREGPDLIFTGTDPQSFFDYNFRRIGNANNIKVASILDYWSFYKDRFFRSKNEDKKSLPDYIFAIDEMAKLGLVECGIDSMKINVMGSPSYQALHKKYFLAQKKNTHSARILFLSQPIHRLHGKKLGFTEGDSLNSFIRVLNSSGVDYRLDVKPHPRENLKEIKRYVQGESLEKTFFLDPHSDLYSGIYKYGLVAGIVSSALIEAAILGIPTLSIQNGKARDFHFFGTVACITPTVFSENELTEKLLSGFDKSIKYPDLSYLYKNATENIVDFLFNILG